MRNFMLGAIGEVIPYDFTNMGWEAKPLIEQINIIAFTELVNRSLFDSFDWGTRVKNMFLRNKLKTVGNVVFLSLEDVNRLSYCGYKTRKEVYDVFLNELNMELKQWNPDKYWESVNVRKRGKLDSKIRASDREEYGLFYSI